MHTIVIQFLFSSIIIVFAGIFLTKFTDKISEVTGWGRMFVGSLFLAGATSLPEFMVDLRAVQLDLPDLAAGDLLGSSLFNLLILAILDFAFPSAFRRTTFSSTYLHHSLAAILSIILTAIIGIGIISRIEISFLGASPISWALVVIYLYGLRLIFLEGNPEQENKNNYENILPFTFRNHGSSLILPIMGYLACALVIMTAAPYLVDAAENIANHSGLGRTFVGTTFVAFATSLPELVATIAAFRIGSPDLALGNIFGSNAFNMLLFFPLDLIYPKIIYSQINSVHAATAFSIVVVMSIAVMGQLFRKKERSRLSEPSSEIIVTVIFLFLFLLYKIKSRN